MTDRSERSCGLPTVAPLPFEQQSQALFGGESTGAYRAEDDGELHDAGDPWPERTDGTVEDAMQRTPLATDDGRIRARMVTNLEREDAQRQLDQYRRRLSQDMELRELSGHGILPGAPAAARVSPIEEESSASASPQTTVPPAQLPTLPPSAPPTSSTESGNTIRGGMTPSLPARTPSYPFPRMASPGLNYAASNRASPGFPPPANASSAKNVLRDAQGLHERILSDPSTPASTITFLPGGAGYAEGEPDFAAPNLYDLSLMLSAEPGLDAWWNTVVQIMVEVYHAGRVTLAVPADTTDIDNVPWGQKATYNGLQEDDLSIGYLARGSSYIASTRADLSEGASQDEAAQPKPENQRPSLQSRHSYTAYEDQVEKSQAGTATTATAIRRPAAMLRSKTSFPSSGGESAVKSLGGNAELNQAALQKHNAEEHQEVPSWEMPPPGEKQGWGRMLPVLQALDYEADPLIDHGGVTRVLDRGHVIALTRSYPYLDPAVAETPSVRNKAMETLKKRPKRARPDAMPKLSSFLGGARPPTSSALRTATNAGADERRGNATAASSGERDHQPATPRYEEYEQAPPSPWSQSPAPSPAVRADPTENPFFTDAVVDEESFNPGSTPQDYAASIRPPEAIGVDNSWTVLHIPLSHVLLSKPAAAFKLDATTLEQRSGAFRGIDDAEVKRQEVQTPFTTISRPGTKEKTSPIAILSILSPIIPYPSSLRHSLEHLAAHLATSFSLCRHYTNLENELHGMQRRRPQRGGFGAVDADGRVLVDYPTLTGLSFEPGDDIDLQRSMAGSITSPSDYSQPSKSATGSPSGTPGWDPTASLGLVVERRPIASSPAPIIADSYFAADLKMSQGRREISSPSVPSSRRDSPTEKRSSLRLSASKPQLQLQETGSEAVSGSAILEPASPMESSGQSIEKFSAATRRRRSLSQDPRDVLFQVPGDDKRLTDPLSSSVRDVDSARKPGGVPSQADMTQHHPVHTHLHSYGADFASTFQSLPPSSTVGQKAAALTSAPTRAGSVTLAQADLPPPSDKLKGLMLDSLPAHVFVALPHTGEIVWVNSRYLTYRGQTAEDLAVDPWSSLHPDDRPEYLKAWGQSVRTGEQFSRTVRIRRFDGVYRYFHARAIASRDKRGVIMQFLGSYMDIHDQHTAELKAARQEEIEASEAKHRLLANLIPQIIFTATEDEGITFANEQWLSYTGQAFEDSLGVGFMDYVHPDDLAKCRIPRSTSPAPHGLSRSEPIVASTTTTTSGQGVGGGSHSTQIRRDLSRQSSSSAASSLEVVTTDLAELARNGVVKVVMDSSGRLSYATEVRLRAKSGEYRWHLVRCVETDNVDFGNGASSYFGSATDINDLKLLEAKLKEAMDSKGRFLSNMSHEIRTPLIGISGMVSFLQDTTLNEEQRDYTNTIQTSANSLLMIINDILDLSKVDAGMMKLNHEWFHTRSLIEDVNELVSTMAIAKRLELNYVVEEDVPAWVKGDKVRIRQVLLNVIGNAIKFTTVGEVFSRCTVVGPEGADLGPDEVMLEFSIIDTGRGFTADEAELMFKPFSQIDGSSTRQHGGSGLGLVISRQLVELHGGTMVGTAVPGEGSTFTFTARFGRTASGGRPDIAAAALPQPTENAAAAAAAAAATEVTPETVAEPNAADPAAALETSPAPAATGQLFPTEPLRHTPSTTDSPMTDAEVASSAVASDGSSQPSVRSLATTASSVSSMTAGLVSFSEAARASGQDLSQIQLELPSAKSSSNEPTPTPSRGVSSTGASPDANTNAGAAGAADATDAAITAATGAMKQRAQGPPVYSILVICPQTHSREATVKHIKMTLPKDIPHQITALASAAAAEELISGADAVNFTHMVVNLPSPAEVISLADRALQSGVLDRTTMLILSDSVQRQAVIKAVTGTRLESALADGSGRRVTYIYKPVKPSRFAVIFDPANERDLSIDRNRSTAQRLVATQKQNDVEMERRLGGKGYRVLLVEDNPVNQKVLRKYLNRVGLEAEVAGDGEECTEKVFGRQYGYYALILCDLHMPRKDGYQACREIREWEARQGRAGMPIIALSANVMSDVQDKCVEAGFSDYVTKPVDFITLGAALSKFF